MSAAFLADSRLFEIEILLGNHSVDILCLSETWLKPKNLNSILSLPGYQESFHQDRITSRGGGVAVYVRHGLAVSVINCVTSPLFQCLVLSIVLSQRKRLTKIICYRPPGSNVYEFIEFLDQVLTDLPANATHILCFVGYFNS